MEGWFKAVNARTGEKLWELKTGSGIIGQPVTYRGPDGKQYVAVLSGVGGWAGAIVAGELDARDSTAALGFANAMRDLSQHSTKGGPLSVLSLPCSRARRAPDVRGRGGRGRHRDGGDRPPREHRARRVASSAAGVFRSQQPPVLERAPRGVREPNG